MNIKETATDPIVTGAVHYYDLTDGGYIKPDYYLEETDALKVKEALQVLTDFKNSLEHKDLIEWM